MTFDEWRDKQVPTLWAKFDISAAKIGWDAALEQNTNAVWLPPPIEVRPDGFECLVWHRGKWRHLRWVREYQGWMRGYGSAYLPGDLGRTFAPLPWNTPEANFYDGEDS